MPRDLDIPNRLARYGVPFTLHRGWDTRGSATLAPRVIVRHATVSNPPRLVPSLDIVRDGRSDVPGPLYNLLGARDNHAHVIAAGRANNAGKGGIFGVTGNSATLGYAREHTNVARTEGYDADAFEFDARVMAALADGHVGADRCVMHWEWAGGRQDPAGAYRKSDFLQRLRWGNVELAQAMRARVAELLRAGGVRPGPAPVFFPAFAGQLGVGARGRKVAEWKYALASNGYGAGMSFAGLDAEVYGAGTAEAVRRLQRDRNALHLMAGGARSGLWDVTGVTGPKTWGYLRWLNAVQKAKG